MHYEDLVAAVPRWSSPESTSASAAGISAVAGSAWSWAATPQLGELRRGETIPWRVIAAQIAPRERHGSC